MGGFGTFVAALALTLSSQQPRATAAEENEAKVWSQKILANARTKATLDVPEKNESVQRHEVDCDSSIRRFEAAQRQIIEAGETPVEILVVSAEPEIAPPGDSLPLRTHCVVVDTGTGQQFDVWTEGAIGDGYVFANCSTPPICFQGRRYLMALRHQSNQYTDQGNSTLFDVSETYSGRCMDVGGGLWIYTSSFCLSAR